MILFKTFGELITGFTEEMVQQVKEFIVHDRQGKRDKIIYFPFSVVSNSS